MYIKCTSSKWQVCGRNWLSVVFGISGNSEVVLSKCQFEIKGSHRYGDMPCTVRLLENGESLLQMWKKYGLKLWAFAFGAISDSSKCSLQKGAATCAVKVRQLLKGRNRSSVCEDTILGSRRIWSRACGIGSCLGPSMHLVRGPVAFAS